MLSVANQEGSARGVRVVYSRRLNSRFWSAFCRLFVLAVGGRSSRRMAITIGRFSFNSSYFQSGAFQVCRRDWSHPSTHVQTVFRFFASATGGSQSILSLAG